MSGSFSKVVQGCIEGVLRFIGCAVSDCAVQAFCVVPGDPFEGFPLDLGHGLPGPQEFDDLGFEQADDAFGESIVVRVADAADGRVDAGVGQAFGVLDCQVLAAADALLRVKRRFETD